MSAICTTYGGIALLIIPPTSAPNDTYASSNSLRLAISIYNKKENKIDKNTYNSVRDKQTITSKHRGIHLCFVCFPALL